MDRIDLKILAELQENAMVSVAQLAEKVGLSTTPCWRRVQNLEKSGVIQRRVTLLDRDELNVGVDVFVSIRTRQHNAEWLADFAVSVSRFPEVVEFYRMSGEVDYLLRVVVPDIAAYDAFYKRLIKQENIIDVSSSFAMEAIKYTTSLPLNYI
ncbi:MAG: Lrp/AsnC family transcriptional regulator [Planctomycetes bacterium]|nr:Lrp/AsnC family transcriptional regulator [Planctomycetota bacterium]